MRIPNPTGRTVLSRHIHSINHKDGYEVVETSILSLIIVCFLFIGSMVVIPLAGISNLFNFQYSQTLSFKNLNQITYA